MDTETWFCVVLTADVSKNVTWEFGEKQGVAGASEGTCRQEKLLTESTGTCMGYTQRSGCGSHSWDN